MTKRQLPPGFKSILKHGFEKVVNQIVAERQKTRSKLLAVVGVVKYPVTHPPRIVATIHLQDGSSHDLTEDQWGKKNYEVTGSLVYKGDELYCVTPPLLSGKRLILIGSEAGVKRL